VKKLVVSGLLVYVLLLVGCGTSPTGPAGDDPALILSGGAQYEPGPVLSREMVAPGEVPSAESQVTPGEVPSAETQVEPGEVPSAEIQVEPGEVPSAEIQVEPGEVPGAEPQIEIEPGEVPGYQPEVIHGQVPSWEPVDRETGPLFGPYTVSLYDQSGASGDPFPLTDAHLFFRDCRGELEIASLTLDKDLLYKIHVYYKSAGYMPVAGEFTADDQVVATVEFSWQGLSGTMFPDEILVISYDEGSPQSSSSVMLRGLIPIEELNAYSQEQDEL